MKRSLSFALAVLLTASMLAGCGGGASPGTGNGAQTPAETTAKAPDAAATDAPDQKSLVELFDTVTDTSDLPDWTGEKLTLRMWNGHGTGDAKREKSTNDVFYPEIERVFGIKIDADNSFDNGGQDLPSKMAILAATDDWPELGQNVMNQDIVDAGKLLDMTELLPTYAPHYYTLAMKLSPMSLETGFTGSGRVYGVGFIDNTVSNMQALYGDVDLERYKYIAVPDERLGVNTQVYVRDDILKLAYPSAKTQDEIEKMYMEKGAFTREDIYDVPVSNREEALQFFRDIKKVIDEHKIMEGNKPVTTTFAWSGQDNWSLLASLNTGLNGLPNVNYFTYFNVAEQKIKCMFFEDAFKKNMLDFNRFVREGIASEASLIENNEIFMNKLNNGEYAVSYSWLIPDDAKIKAAGKPYRYRKVYFDIAQDLTYALNQKEAQNLARNGMSLFTDKIDQKDVPRVMAFLDYFYSDIGQKAMVWGPRSAGLFEEKDGVRRYTDKDLEDCMVYGVVNDADLKYNLASSLPGKGFPPAYPKFELGIVAGGLNNPKYTYDLSTMAREPGNANNFFQSGLFDQQVRSSPILKTSDIWQFTDEIPEAKRFWDVRGTGFEPMMTKVLAAKDDAEFEDAYAKMCKFAQDNGLNDDAMEAMNALIQEKYPDDWETLKKGFNK